MLNAFSFHWFITWFFFFFKLLIELKTNKKATLWEIDDVVITQQWLERICLRVLKGKGRSSSHLEEGCILDLFIFLFPVLALVDMKSHLLCAGWLELQLVAKDLGNEILILDASGYYLQLSRFREAVGIEKQLFTLPLFPGLPFPMSPSPKRLQRMKNKDLK